LERTRSAARPAEDLAPPSLEAAPALRPLLEEVHAPGAGRDDVDALLRALAGPPGAEESPRERANVLLEMLNDSRLLDVTGSDGRSLRAAALDALVALGYPYALEVPPDILTELRPSKSSSLGKGFYMGLVLPLVVLMVQAAYLSAAASRTSHSSGHMGSLEYFLLTIAALSTVLPMLLGAAGAVWRVRWLNVLGTGALALVGAGWLLMFIAALESKGSAGTFIPLGFCVAHLASAVGLFYPGDED
jgi:hypothetical protein